MLWSLVVQLSDTQLRYNTRQDSRNAGHMVLTRSRCEHCRLWPVPAWRAHVVKFHPPVYLWCRVAIHSYLRGRPKHPSHLLASTRCCFDGLVYNVRESRGIEALQSCIGGPVRARHVFSELGRVIGRLDQHLAGTKAGLLGQARRLLRRKS